MTVNLEREKIQKLVNDAIDKYVTEGGDPFTRNNTPDKYKGFAKKLSRFSRAFPTFDLEKIKDPLNEITDDDYMSNKLDISTVQIREACLGKVENLKDYFYEALHWYLYEKPSRKVEHVPGTAANQPMVQELKKQISHYQSQIADNESKIAVRRKRSVALLVIAATLLAACLLFVYGWLSAKKQFDTLRTDMRILPYKPTQAEIDHLTGVWIAYTGSPQTRTSNTNTERWRTVVKDVVNITYKDGYFTFDRFGPSLSHPGYMQFEGPGLVSIHSYLIDSGVAKPKLSLLELEKGKDTFDVMSASWSWDKNNVIIGIREVYIKQGKGGKIKLAPEYDQLGSKGRIFHWTKESGQVNTMEVKQENLDTLPKSLHPLLNESSFIPMVPDSNIYPKKPVPK